MEEYKKAHKEKGPFIKEIEEGQRFVGFYVLRKKQLETFKDASRGKYLTLILGDLTGQLVAKVWEGGEALNTQLIQGEVVKVDGQAELYNDKIQLKIMMIRLATQNEYDISDMLPCSEKDPAELLHQLMNYVKMIEDPNLKPLVESFFHDQEFMELFVQAPAGKRIHHAYIHGLIEHVLEICELAVPLVANYAGVIDEDLLYTGILLHDIGKINEYIWGVDIEFTDEGRLLGHIIIADAMIMKKINTIEGFPWDLAMEIRHLIHSHHGEHEFGSSVKPHTIEAMALHQLDNLSAQVNRFKLILNNKSNGGNWTDFDVMLGRFIYSKSRKETELKGIENG